MNLNEYNEYYRSYIDTALAYNELDECIYEYDEKREVYVNYIYAIKVMLLIAVIENNFTGKSGLRDLRNFKTVSGLKVIHQSILSCFVYVRDCIGHNVSLEMFETDGANDKQFRKCIENKECPYIRLDGNKILLDHGCIHYLHLMILGLYNDG